MHMPVGPTLKSKVWVDAAQDIDETEEKRLVRKFWGLLKWHTGHFCSIIKFRCTFLYLKSITVFDGTNLCNKAYKVYIHTFGAVPLLGLKFVIQFSLSLFFTSESALKSHVGLGLRGGCCATDYSTASNCGTPTPKIVPTPLRIRVHL
jgi:hypothetical protein